MPPSSSTDSSTCFALHICSFKTNCACDFHQVILTGPAVRPSSLYRRLTTKEGAGHVRDGVHIHKLTMYRTCWHTSGTGEVSHGAKLISSVLASSKHRRHELK